jgi:hypothetical protein
MGPQTALLLKDFIPEMSMKDSQGARRIDGQAPNSASRSLPGDDWPGGWANPAGAVPLAAAPAPSGYPMVERGGTAGRRAAASPIRDFARGPADRRPRRRLHRFPHDHTSEAFIEELRGAATSPLPLSRFRCSQARARWLPCSDSRAERRTFSSRCRGRLPGIAVIGLCIFVLFSLGEHVSRRIGPAGFAALTTITGLIVLSIGVEMVVHGVIEHAAVVGVT